LFKLCTSQNAIHDVNLISNLPCIYVSANIDACQF